MMGPPCHKPPTKRRASANLTQKWSALFDPPLWKMTLSQNGPTTHTHRAEARVDLDITDNVLVEGEIVLPGTPWDQMPGETTVAYNHFLAYRDCGADRTVARAADQAHKSRDHFHRLASQWQWIPRAHAWDVEQHRQFTARAVQARRDMIERHAKLGKFILGIVETRLLQIPIDELTPGEVVRLAEVAAKLERSAWQDESRLALVGASTPDGVDLTHLDEQGRLRRLEELRNELDRRIRARRQMTAIEQAGDAA